MTTNHHTAISAGAAANASTFNTPLGALDAQITTNAAAITANALLAAATTAEVVAARGSSPDLDARLDALVLAGGNVATKANGASVAGQKVLTVDATDGFIVNAYVTYLLNGTTLEGNTIASVQAGVSLTLGTNIGTGGVLDDSYISMISISEYQAAQAIPHAAGTVLMLPSTVEYTNAARYHPMAFGCVGGGTTDDRTAFNTLVNTTMSSGGTVMIDRSYKIGSNMTVPAGVTLKFEQGGQLVVPTGVTVTINGVIDAGRYRIFVCTGTGSVILGSGTRFPEWWGAQSDASADATQQSLNVTAFQAALNQQGEVFADPDAYYILNGRIRLSSHTWLHGGGKTRLVWGTVGVPYTGVGIDTVAYDGAGSVYATRVENFKISDIALESTQDSWDSGSFTQTAGNYCIQIGTNVSSENAMTWGGEPIENVIFNQWGDSAIYFTGRSYSMRIHNCRFNNVWNAVEVNNVVSNAVTGTHIYDCVFDLIANDVLYAVDVHRIVFGPGNVTEQVAGYYTHLDTCFDPWVGGNRWEGADAQNDFAHLWIDVFGGHFDGSTGEYIHLDASATGCKYNDIVAVYRFDGFAFPRVLVYEDTANGCSDNNIRIFNHTASTSYYDYAPTDDTIASKVESFGYQTAPVEHAQFLTVPAPEPGGTSTTFNITHPGTYEVTAGTAAHGNIIIQLPVAASSPTMDIRIVLIATSGGIVTIKAQAAALDSGKIDGANGPLLLQRVGDYAQLKPAYHREAFGVHPYALYLANGWRVYGRRLCGAFTCAGSDTTTISNSGVRANSIILMTPTSASAATLMSGAAALYHLDNSATNYFRVTTANGAAAAGTETFNYVIL